MNGKILKIFGGVAIAVLVFVFLVGKYAPEFEAYKYKWEAERLQKMIDEKKAKLDEARRNDTFGGKTPEETFDLFLDSLNKGDIELASKYYDVTVQDKALEGLQKELSEKGNLEQSLAYFNDVRKGEKKCAEIENSCVWNFLDSNLGGEKFLSLVLEQNSLLWKITKPY